MHPKCTYASLSSYWVSVVCWLLCLQPVDFSFQSATDRRIGWWKESRAHIPPWTLVRGQQGDPGSSPGCTDYRVAPTRIVPLALSYSPIPTPDSLTFPKVRIVFLLLLKAMTPFMYFWGFYSEPDEGFPGDRESENPMYPWVVNSGSMNGAVHSSCSSLAVWQNSSEIFATNRRT